MPKKPVILFIIMACGLLLRLNQLSGRSLWADEFFTLFQSTGHAVGIKNFLSKLSAQEDPELVAAGEIKAFMKRDPRMNIADVTRGLLETDTHPPLYFWVIYFWMKLSGDSVLGIRLFSVLMGLSCVLLAYSVTRQLFDEKAALFSAAFVSVSAFAVRYAQEARSYSLVIALGLAASLFLLRLEKTNAKRDALGFALMNALGIYTHYFYIFIACAHFFYFTVTRRKDSARLDRFYLSFLSSLIMLIPWVIAVTRKGYNFYLAEWIFGYPGIGSKLFYLISGVTRYFYIFEPSTPAGRFAMVSAWILVIYLGAIIFREAAKAYRRQVFFCLCMSLVPISAMLFIDLLQKGALLQQERFWAVPFLGIIPLSGYSLSRLFAGKKALVCLVFATMIISSALVSRIQFGPAPKDLALWINRQAQGKRAGVVIYNIRSAVLSQAYYLDDGISMIAVSSPQQLQGALKLAPRLLDKVFLVRYFHRTDNILMDQLFMDIQDIGPDFQLKASLKRDDISVKEYDPRR